MLSATQVHERRLFIANIVLIAPFFKPVFLQYESSLIFIDRIFIIWKILAALYILLTAVLRINTNRTIQYKFIGPVITFEIWMVLTTVLNSGDIERSLIDAVTIIALTIHTVHCWKHHKGIFLRALHNWLLLLVVAQLGSEVFYPNGIPADLYTNQFNPLYFTTVDNGTGPLLLLYIASTALLANEEISSKKSLVLQYVLTLITAVFSGSSTALLVSVAAIFLYACMRTFNIRLFGKPAFWVILMVAVLLAMLLASNSAIINSITMLLFNKSSNFTGRSLLWSTAMGYIAENPIIGYGRQEVDYLPVWGGHYSSHNLELETALQGGLIAILLLAIIIINAYTYNKQTNKSQVLQLESNLLYGATFCCFVALQMEASVHSVYFFIFLAMIYGSKGQTASKIEEL